MCTAGVDHVELESGRGLAEFGDEATCINSDAVRGLTSKPKPAIHLSSPQALPSVTWASSSALGHPGVFSTDVSH